MFTIVVNAQAPRGKALIAYDVGLGGQYNAFGGDRQVYGNILNICFE